MRKTPSVLLAATIFVLLVLAGAQALHAQMKPPDALAGTVTSAKEGPMEGVIVSAKRLDSTMTVSVVSESGGHFHFPASHLGPGDYAISIRAAGYQLDRALTLAVVAARGTTTTNLRLVPVKDLSAALSDAEWLASMPGTEDQKLMLLDCNACHDLQRIVRSSFTSDEWIPVLSRMMGLYVYNAAPWIPQQRAVPRQIAPASVRPLADYLASINLSGGRSTWSYELKTLPRPSGLATHVIVTEYDLPRRTALPHDVVIGPQGYAWYVDFAWPFLGRLDPRTGAVTDYPIPVVKPAAAKGSNDLEIDPQGNLWIGMLQQSAIGRFDTATKTYKIWPLTPPSITSSIAMVTLPSSADGGRLWTNDEGLQGMHRLDPATNTWENYGPLVNEQGHKIAPYGIFADKQNNGYVLDYGLDGRYIGKLDAKTGKLTMYAAPSEHARLRRGRLDDDGAFWVAEYGANKVARFDLATTTYREYAMPTAHTFPYDAVRDKNGEVWTGSMWNDHVVRFDPQTGRFIEYLLPHETNMRRMFVDNTTNPVTFWSGNNLHASIVRLEPTSD